MSPITFRQRGAQGRSIAPACTRRLLAVALAMLAAACAGGPETGWSQQQGNALETALARDIAVLAGDDLEGRAPGTIGEARTLAYLQRQWQAAGIAGGTNLPANEWRAPVAIVAREPIAASARFERRGRGGRWQAIDVPAGDLPAGDLVVTTGAAHARVVNAPLLLVHEDAVPDPEILAGRIAVPVPMSSGSSEQASNQLSGDLLARWQAREERARALIAAGAAAVLLVESDAGAFRTMAAARRRSSYALDNEKADAMLIAYAGPDAAQAILGEPRFERSFASGGGKARRSAVPLAVRATFEAANDTRTVLSHNLIGRIAGSDPDAGAILLLAHWDHLGLCRPAGAADRICNGAVDNAAGLAILTEIGRRLASGPQLTRDVYLLATTAEEWGLLGTAAFAADPPLPLPAIVAAFNIDTEGLVDAGGPLAIIGAGRTRLDPVIAEVAAAQGLTIADPGPASAFLRRQDGWALLQAGVPAVMITASLADPAVAQVWLDTIYHGPEDEAGPALRLGGAADIVRIHVALVRRLADAPADGPPDPRAPPPGFSAATP